MPEPQGARIPASRGHPPHAAKAMSNQQMIPDGLSDGDHISKLIQLGSNQKSIRKVQAMAAKTIKALGVPGLVYPKKSCAAVVSHFLREAGIDLPVATGAQNLAGRMRV